MNRTEETANLRTMPARGTSNQRGPARRAFITGFVSGIGGLLASLMLIPVSDIKEWFSNVYDQPPASLFGTYSGTAHRWPTATFPSGSSLPPSSSLDEHEVTLELRPSGRKVAGRGRSQRHNVWLEFNLSDGTYEAKSSILRGNCNGRGSHVRDFSGIVCLSATQETLTGTFFGRDARIWVAGDVTLQKVIEPLE